MTDEQTAADGGTVAALAEKWQAVLDECKQADPKWILDRSVTALETCLRELRAALPTEAPAMSPEGHRIMALASERIENRRAQRDASAPAQGDRLEMSRKVEQAERRAEDAEAAIEAARSEALRTAAREFVDGMAEAWGGDSQWLTTGTRVAEVVACVLREMAADIESECAHQWLDRPESDTRECLICGTEVSG